MQALGREKLISSLKKMILIRTFEVRAESAYQQGKVGGFFHAYIGQEAIQTACVLAAGEKQWYIASYRCHALALLLGASPNELMAELYGKETGNAKGRGGSMHFFTERLLGGFGIVGGQIPIAAGAAFAAKYKGLKEVAFCFMGDGAVAQGTFHETLNMAALMDLPCIFVIENNLWGMGTAVHRAISVKRLAEDKASSFGISGYTVNGMNFFECYEAFSSIYKDVIRTNRPVLVEVVTERFRGHSISDPALYRTKDALKEAMKRDPILFLQENMIQAGMITQEEVKEIEKQVKKEVLDSMDFAEKSPWPAIDTLEKEVFAP